MRGAGLRLTTDVRRVWQCAVCNAERKVGAQVTTVRCQCNGRPAMKLVEAQRRERPLKELASPYLEFVFDPGELAAPRSQVADAPAPSINEQPTDTETAVAVDREVNEGGHPTPEGAGQRPPRRNDRRGSRGPEPARGPKIQNDNAARRDQQPRQRDEPKNERPAAPPSAPDNSSFGEGIASDHTPAPPRPN